MKRKTIIWSHLEYIDIVLPVGSFIFGIDPVVTAYLLAF
jgi:hypothetical protein